MNILRCVGKQRRVQRTQNKLAFFINSIIQADGMESDFCVANFLLPIITDNTLQSILMLNIVVIL
jgi:hypothetical protein